MSLYLCVCVIFSATVFPTGLATVSPIYCSVSGSSLKNIDSFSKYLPQREHRRRPSFTKIWVAIELVLLPPSLGSTCDQHSKARRCQPPAVAVAATRQSTYSWWNCTRLLWQRLLLHWCRCQRVHASAEPCSRTLNRCSSAGSRPGSIVLAIRPASRWKSISARTDKGPKSIHCEPFSSRH